MNFVHFDMHSVHGRVHLNIHRVHLVMRRVHLDMRRVHLDMRLYTHLAKHFTSLDASISLIGHTTKKSRGNNNFVSNDVKLFCSSSNNAFIFVQLDHGQNNYKFFPDEQRGDLGD